MSREGIKHQRNNHYTNRHKEQTATAEFCSQSWEKCDRRQADNNIDNAQERNLRGIAENVSKIVQVEVINDILTETENQISQRNPHQLIILRQNFENIGKTRFLFVFAKFGLLLFRSDTENNRAEN